MRKFMNWVMLILIVVVTFKVVMWAYEGFTSGGEKPAQKPVLDMDISCLKVPDTGACICRHRDTSEILDISYDECVSRAVNK